MVSNMQGDVASVNGPLYQIGLNNEVKIVIRIGIHWVHSVCHLIQALISFW